MSLEGILKNIYTFVDVLQTARGDKVKDWDRHMVDNAIRWAKYAQQIYIQANGKPYQSDLDGQIQHLGYLPWSLGNLSVNLELLKNAESLMKESLLQNPWLDPGTFQYVVSLYDLHSPQGLEAAIQVFYKLNTDKSTLDLFTSLCAGLSLDPVSSEQQEARVQSLKTVGVTTQARLLATLISGTLKKSPPHKKEKTVKFLEKKITEFSEKAGAISILATLLQSKFPDILTTADEENATKTVVLQAILDLPTPYRQEFKELMHSDVKSP